MPRCRLSRRRVLNRRGRGFGAASGPVQAGPQVAKASVKALPATVPFYDLSAYRTIFDFEDADWEDQLMAFKETDIELPSTMTVDGKSQGRRYPVPEAPRHS